ncbi:MAG TPA: hypothetical protein VF618_14925 [Thermoanaerobaculia bacterium]
MRLLVALAALFLFSCPSTKAPALPPGPDDPVKNLAQLDAFADRVQFEAINAAWLSATEPESNAKAKPFGILPLLLLTDREVAALQARLREPEHLRCLQAVHSIAVRMQSEADRHVAPRVAAIAALRLRMPDLSRVYTDEADVVLREQHWSSQAGWSARRSSSRISGCRRSRRRCRWRRHGSAKPWARRRIAPRGWRMRRGRGESAARMPRQGENAWPSR